MKSMSSTPNQLKKFLPKHRVQSNRYFSKGNESANYSGVYLGKDSSTGFIPSLMFLETLKDKLNSISVGQKAAWLFTTKKNILHTSVQGENHSHDSDIYLVMTQKGEILGLAKKTIKDYQNIWDIGYYLRREIDR